jgi:hypothetical protein
MLTYEDIGIGDDTTGGSGFLISRFGTPMRESLKKKNRL